ncbi:zinc-binding dehydrogenase [Streptomyces tubercidicus]|uniref:Oxidoreductase n=1 Tax=Streptomyces tubercidicus TaxID=47759 RepID=A0A640UXK2_9ACTN|nr:zinc-binding dehydrogenase [Streptomyces tubercidicus]WAU13593.1 zinc-binding dehydrogenase [Streptomyces tubercidicus]GFE39215.1 oxidoreductase [Streptomyces tubercidicus]
MRALVVDHSVPGRLALGEVPDPVPGPDEVLVKISAISLNYGELPKSDDAAEGTVPGWDAAGVVERAAASGRGPKPGDRVITFGWDAGWAELRAVPVGELAVLPDAVDFATAAALPVAGVTALRALRRAGVRPGQRVAITGASGGVGRFAVQLAHQAGAEVHAFVGSPARGAGLAALGADHVLTDTATLDGEVDVLLDNVGGALLGELLGRMAPGGTVISIGATSGEPTPVQPYQLVAGQLKLIGIQAGGDAGADLAHLVRLVAEGRLESSVDRVADWSQAGQTALALVNREIRGKAVLTIT